MHDSFLDRANHHLCVPARMRNKLLLVCLCFLAIVSAHEHSHTYDDGEEVVIWMNTVGPYHNRQETYSYFSLPFCVGPKKDIGHYHETLGEALQGIELEFSGLDLDFKRSVQLTKFCEITLTEEMYLAFVYAVKNQYWYQMYIDDLPIWGLVGEVGAGEKEDEPAYFIYTHKRFDVGYNVKQIVDVNLTVSEKVQLKVGAKLTFSYEANWVPSSIPFADRFDKYLDPNFFQHRIHWFSIFNSFMMVIFLVGLVSMILMRTLRKDYARYSTKEADDFDDLERDLGDEYGWKQVHGDVFRAPAYPELFATLIGNGNHVAAVMFIVVLLTIVGEYYTERGSFLSAILFVYSACSPINGFFGGSQYARFGGKRWIRQMLCGALALPACIAAVSMLVNSIALAYHSARSIAFTTALALLAICLFVLLPLNLVGCVIGRNVAGAANWPCRVNAVPRPIPEKKWFLEPVLIVLLGGVLPFGSIFIEMYFVFTSFWAYKIYYVFGFMLLVVIIMFAVVACVTVVCTYFLLNSEDYRWHWTSFAAGASTAFYVYMYSIYYYLFKTKMFGLFQTTFYFSYMALFCVALGVMCGTVGYVSSALFVRKIYSTVKID